jgi:hypothetical protein
MDKGSEGGDQASRWAVPSQGLSVSRDRPGVGTAFRSLIAEPNPRRPGWKIGRVGVPRAADTVYRRADPALASGPRHGLDGEVHAQAGPASFGHLGCHLTAVRLGNLADDRQAEP